MSGRLFSFDDVTKAVETFHYDESTGSFTIEDQQPVDGLLDINHHLRGEKRDRKAFQRHVAAVPENIYWYHTMRMRKEGRSSAEIMEWWKEWLNNSDNKDFKSIEGRI